MGPFPWDGSVSDSIETRYSPHVLPYQIVAVCQAVSEKVGSPKNWGTLPPPPCDGTWLIPRNMLLSHLRCRTKFGHSRSNCTSVITEMCRKF